MRYNNLYHVNKIQEDPLSSKAKKEMKPKKPLAIEICDLKTIDSKRNLCYCWLGHSSIFVQINGYKILIDPVFSKCLSPIPPFGPKRFPGPIPTASDFPKLDAILISHNHHDHLDQKTIQAFNNQTRYFIVPLGIKSILKRFGIDDKKIIELNWGEEFHFHRLTIYCTTAHHNSTRYLFDQDKTLWCSYVIQDKNNSIFYSGDSAFSQHFHDISNRFNSFDLAFIECGQYGKPWHNCHMFPEESVEACKILKAKCSIPVHWGSYVLSTHSWNEPPTRFARKAKEENIQFIIPKLYEIESID